MKPQRQIDLSRIFNLDNFVRERRLQLLSATSSPFPMTDDEFNPRLALLRKFISTGRVPRKPGGTIYSDNELLCLPLDKMQKLFDETEPEDAPGKRGESPDESPSMRKLNVDLHDVFNAENNLTLLSARLDKSFDDRQKIEVLKEFVALGKFPKDTRGNVYTADELCSLPTATLRIIIANMR